MDLYANLYSVIRSCFNFDEMQSKKTKKYTSIMLKLMENVHGRGGIPVLTYHSIDNSGSNISVTPTQFRKQMEYFQRRGYRTISLPNLLEHLGKEEKLPARTIVITFDDGFMNNYEVGFPVLQDYGMTATIFVVTDLIGKVCAWGKDEGFPETPLMSWTEIDEMHRHGIDIQPHSCTHPCLPLLDGARIIDEVLRSRQVIEQKLGKEANVFCYPYGRFSDEVIQALKTTGYVGAVTTIFGRNTGAGDRYRLRRVGSAHFTSRARFKVAMHPGYDLYVLFKTAITKRGFREDIVNQSSISTS